MDIEDVSRSIVVLLPIVESSSLVMQIQDPSAFGIVRFKKGKGVFVLR